MVPFNDDNPPLPSPIIILFKSLGKTTDVSSVRALLFKILTAELEEYEQTTLIILFCTKEPLVVVYTDEPEPEDKILKTEAEPAPANSLIKLVNVAFDIENIPQFFVLSVEFF